MHSQITKTSDYNSSIRLMLTTLAFSNSGMLCVIHIMAYQQVIINLKCDKEGYVYFIQTAFSVPKQHKRKNDRHSYILEINGSTKFQNGN